MKTRRNILPAVCCISLLSACASNQSVSVAPWSIAPMTTVRNSSNNPAAMYQTGRYYQGQNRYDLAITAYQKALAAEESHVEARNGLGVIYSRQGKYQAAIEAFQTAIQQAPKAAHLYSNLGYAYYLHGQYDESVAALEQATALDPANQRALNNLGLAYAKAGSRSESAQAFAQAAETLGVAAGSVVSPPQSPPPQVEQVSEDATTPADTNVVAAPEMEAQVLALPKDRGIIRPASAAHTVPVVDSRVTLVQLAPKVYELRAQQVNAEPAQATAVVEVPSTRKLLVEVSNGNGVAGMAAKMGEFLRSQGYPALRLTNQKSYQVRMTQIHYREGHQAEAQRLKLSLAGEPELTQRNDLRVDVGVRVVLGKDMTAPKAFVDGKGEKLQIALNASES